MGKMNLAVSGLLKDSLCKYDYVWMKLVGKSMLPFLKNGTSIAVRKADIKDIHIGDIVVFKKGNNAIAHRVFKKVNIDGRFFLRAKSDISFLSEPLIDYEELIGKVVAFKRFGREVRIDNLIFRLLGLAAAFSFPFIAKANYSFKCVTNYVIQS
ncbi:MAG: hypothetical protein AMJ78_03460 [Omnitrophica WOR_2 bacterium SM23_29]|nr:MAG: hypothetical protein AMJ78_03460 [Omnitrophica WOR_2 bacterium SM23_29]